MEVEISIAGKCGHWIEAVKVATFLARSVSTGVKTLVKLNIVAFTVGTAKNISYDNIIILT